jgi:hypothetical protein
MKSRFTLFAGVAGLSLLVLSVAGNAAPAANAAGFPGPDLHPWFKIHEHRLDGPGPLPAILLSDDDLLVTRGGGFSFFGVFGNTAAGPYRTVMAQGVAAPDAFAQLARILGTMQVGSRNETCRTSAPAVNSADVQYVFSWFGKGNRRSTSTVRDDPSLPDCSFELQGLIREFYDFKTQILNDPATRIQSSP